MTLPLSKAIGFLSKKVLTIQSGLDFGQDAAACYKLPFKYSHHFDARVHLGIFMRTSNSPMMLQFFSKNLSTGCNLEYLDCFHAKCFGVSRVTHHIHAVHLGLGHGQLIP